MPETLEAPVKNPTLGDLRSMLTRSEPEKPAKPEPSEPAAPAAEKPIETAPEPVQIKQQEEVEEELPENVKKRIEKETRRQAEIQSKIDQAVSSRKAKEKELADLDGKQGSEPVKQTEPKKSARPTRPDLATFPGTLAEYNAAVSEYETKFEEWIGNQSRESVRQELTQQQQQETAKKAWDEAQTKHGAEFPALMDVLAKSLPAQLQTAISALDDWSSVAVHLAKNEGDREALITRFKDAPLSAIASLGKLEAQLTPAATPQQTEKPPLPKPLKPIAGGPSGSLKPLDMQNAPMSEFKSEVRAMLKRR